MRPTVPDAERYEDGIKQAAKGLLNVANVLAETIDSKPEDETSEETKFRAFLWDTMELCRSMADRIDPPQEDWPDKVVPFSKGKRRK